MLTMVKLGGSLITDKLVESSFRREAAQRVAQEIARALGDNPSLRLIVGHGSGSFGHVVAKKHGTKGGVNTPEQWRGFAQVSTIAAELNFLMASTLQSEGIAVMRFQPSASAVSAGGRIHTMAVDPIQRALNHGLVPLVYGDVAFDDELGGTIISTETVFMCLAQQLPVSRILLLGEVDGVYDPTGAVIPEITPQNLSEVEHALGGSRGVDVTGGMETKVRDMVALAKSVSGLRIKILNGLRAGELYDNLIADTDRGTLIHAPAG